MNEIERMRVQIASVYRSFTWAEKVKAMSDAQVIAVHRRFSIERKF